MGPEIEANSPAPDGGAGLENQQQGSEQTSQDVGQNQTTGTSSVEGSSTDASSVAKPGRSNSSWANQRLIEKAVEKALQGKLETALSPFLEKLEKSANPPAAQSQTNETPDYNDLSGWINRRVNDLLQQQLSAQLPKQLNQFQTKLQGDFQKTTAMQEARNYLLSQKEIGNDEVKLAEIRKIMTDNLLDYAVEARPLESVQKAVNIWKSQRVNPNAPSKDQLSTVAGGAANQGKRDLSVKDLVELQRKLSNNPTLDEQAKLYSEIESLMAP